MAKKLDFNFKKIWVPNLATISSTFPDFNHREQLISYAPDVIHQLIINDQSH